jgi:hypothetical protein
MSVDMTKSFAFTVCTTDGGTAIAVQKRGSVSERFSGGLDHEYRVQIGLETWGDNNARGDIKVNNKVDNKVWGDTVNDTVKRPQTRTRTTTPYNTRTSPVQHPYKSQRCLWGEVIRGGVLKHSPLTNSLNEKVHETFAAAHNFVAPMHGGEAA